MDEKLLYTWRLFVRHWGALVCLFVGASVLSQIPSLFTLDSPADALTREDFIAGAISFLIGAVVSPLGIAAAYVILDDGTRGASPPIGKALGRAFGRIVPLVFWWFVVTFLALVGMVFFIVPGIYAWIKWSFTLFVVMDPNRRRPGTPLTQSFELTRGYGWYIFGAMLLFSIPIAAVGIGVTVASVAVPEWANYIWLPVGVVGAVLYAPVYVFLFVCYREATLGAGQAEEDLANT